METLKSLDEVLSPDQRNLRFINLDGAPTTLENHHASIAGIHLNPTAPEAVSSYFATIQNVCLYAWFAYDFYPVVQSLCFSLIELALAKRLPVQGRDNRRLNELLMQMLSQRLIRPKKFTHIRNARQAAAERLRMERKIIRGMRSDPQMARNYPSVLADAIRKMRNIHAHPRMHMIITPGDALDQLQLTAEFINQLFPTDGA